MRWGRVGSCFKFSIAIVSIPWKSLRIHSEVIPFQPRNRLNIPIRIEHQSYETKVHWNYTHRSCETSSVNGLVPICREHRALKLELENVRNRSVSSFKLNSWNAVATGQESLHERFHKITDLLLDHFLICGPVETKHALFHQKVHHTCRFKQQRPRR